LKYDNKNRGYDISEAELIDLYNNKKWNQEEIAEHFGCSRWVIADRLKKLGDKIEYRSRKTSIGLNPKYLKSVKSIKKILQLIDGVIISDGHIQYRPENGQNKTARIIVKQSIKKKEWLDYLKLKFEEKGMKCKLLENEAHLKGKTHIEYSLQTESYKELKDEYERWYLSDNCFCVSCNIALDEESIERKKWKNTRRCPVCNEHHLSKKIIPKDIELSPILLANWLMGDGNVSPTWVSKKTKKQYYRITMHTEGFLKVHNEFLVKQLNSKYRFRFKLKPKPDNIYVIVNNHQDEILEFLRITSQDKVDCFKYKWRALDDPLAGIQKKKWTENENEILKRDWDEYYTASPKLLEMGRTERAIRQQGNKLGLHKAKKIKNEKQLVSLGGNKPL